MEQAPSQLIVIELRWAINMLELDLQSCNQLLY